MKISPRSYPGDEVLDVLIFKGPKTDAFTLLPRICQGEHIPHDHIEGLRVRRSLTVEADRPLPIEADGESSRDPRDVRRRPSGPADEAVSVARLRARIERATAQAAEEGLAGLLVTPGSDLVFLMGYDPLRSSG